MKRKKLSAFYYITGMIILFVLAILTMAFLLSPETGDLSETGFKEGDSVICYLETEKELISKYSWKIILDTGTCKVKIIEGNSIGMSRVRINLAPHVNLEFSIDTKNLSPISDSKK